MHRRGFALAALGLLCLSPGARAAVDASAVNALDRYLSGLNSLNAEFRQTVTNADGSQTESGTGRLTVQRPGKFRWEYTPAEGADGAPSEVRGQLLVADGRNVWFYDRELAQVTVKPVVSALSSTPIALLSGSAAQLHDSFDITPSGHHDGLDWVEVRPRSAEADFSRAQLGFSGDSLIRMIVNDRLGQTMQLDFSRSERNPRVDPALLRFQPPPGVDVIGTPLS